MWTCAEDGHVFKMALQFQVEGQRGKCGLKEHGRGKPRRNV